MGCAIAQVGAMMGWRLMGPLGGFPGLVLGSIAGVVALVAITRRGERALAVFLSVLPLGLVVVFVLGELLIGHE